MSRPPPEETPQGSVPYSFFSSLWQRQPKGASPSAASTESQQKQEPPQNLMTSEMLERQKVEEKKERLQQKIAAMVKDESEGRRFGGEKSAIPPSVLEKQESGGSSLKSTAAVSTSMPRGETTTAHGSSPQSAVAQQLQQQRQSRRSDLLARMSPSGGGEPQRQGRTLSGFSSLSIGSSIGTTKVDARPAIVLEIGQRITRVGIAGEYVPRAMFRTELTDPMEPSKRRPIFDDQYSTDEQHIVLIKFLKRIAHTHLLTSFTNRRLVVVESPLVPTKQRNALARALFECPSLAPHSLLFAPSPLMSIIPFNAKNCLVADLGAEETRIFPMAEGFLMLNQCETLPLGSSTLERRVHQMMLQHGQVLTENGPRAFGSDKDLELFERNRIAEDIVVRFCFATLMPRGRNLQEHFADQNQSIANKLPPDVQLPFDSGFLIVPGIVREGAAEVLFEDGLPNCDPSLPQAILECVAKAPIDIRLDLLRNLLVVGGLARMQGLLARLKSELLRLLASGYTAPHLSNDFADIRFHQFAAGVAGQLFSGWLGGSHFGELESALDARSLTREDWLTRPEGRRSVPDWTDQIDDYWSTLPPPPAATKKGASEDKNEEKNP